MTNPGGSEAHDHDDLDGFQSQLFWTGERDDPSAVGRGRPELRTAQKLGCAAIIAVIVIGAVLLITTDLPALAVVGVTAGSAAILALGLGLANARWGPAPAAISTYSDRAGWSALRPDHAMARVCGALIANGHPQLGPQLADSATLTTCSRVSRPGGEGTIATTAPITVRVNKEQSTTVGARLCVWVDLASPLPALAVVPLKGSGIFVSESHAFNQRYVVLQSRLPQPPWDREALQQYCSAVLSARVLEILIDAFPGMPPILIADGAIGAVLDWDTPYRAELTLDVLCAIRAALPTFLYDRYAERSAAERHFARRCRRGPQP